MIMKNNYENRPEVYVFQYILDSKAGIVRDELYEYLILRTFYDHKEKSFSKENILSMIKKNYSLEEFPNVHFEPALKRLQKKKKVNGKTVLTLPEDVIKEIHENNEKYIEFMNSIHSDLKTKIAKNIPSLSSTLIDSITENFFKLLGRTFTIHGKVLSRMIVEQNSTIEDLKTYAGFGADYKELIFDHVYPQHHDSLDEIFNNFLFKSSEEQSKFIYTMAQGHTLYQILNVDPDLNKIQENVLSETKIYLDTNVVISLLFLNTRPSDSIKNIIQQSKAIGINFFITNVTKNEFDNWLDTNKKEAGRIREIPKELLKALFKKDADAPLLISYLTSLRTHPHQTIDQFCLGFEDITKNLEKDYGIGYEEEDFSIYEEHEKYSNLSESIHHANPTKSLSVVKHDTLNILKIKEYRKNNPSGILGPKGWFLTTDSTLWRAEREAFFDEISASITAQVWLQIISPLISPKLRIEDTMKSFTKLLSTNFGTSSMIKQEDILNIAAAFIDDKGLNEKDFDGILGNKHVRNTLRKLHTSHIKQDKKEEEKWTRESMKAVSHQLKDKRAQEIEAAITGLKARLDKHEGTIGKQTTQISEQDVQIKELKENQEKKWAKNFKILLFIAIGISVIIPIISLLGLGLSINQFLAIIGIEAASIIGIFVPWKLKHKPEKS